MRQVPFDASLVGCKHVTVKDKEGNTVRIICTDAVEVEGEQPIVGIVDGQVETYCADGRWIEGEDNDEDLHLEIDDEGFKKENGFDPMEAAALCALLFGDPTQYSSEELELAVGLVSVALAN